MHQIVCIFLWIETNLYILRLTYPAIDDHSVTYIMPCVHIAKLYMIHICSGLTRGRVLNGELYAQRLHKLIYLHLLTGCFMTISLQSSELTVMGFQSYQFFIYNKFVGILCGQLW